MIEKKRIENLLDRSIILGLNTALKYLDELPVAEAREAIQELITKTKAKIDKPAHVCGEAEGACEECCEHEFDSEEGFTCLNCGKEGAEEVMSLAADRAKDQRKYGDT